MNHHSKFEDMTQEQLDQIAEYVMRGIQASKSEVSNLHHEINNKLKELVKDMAETKKTLQNQDIASYEHRKRVEPMLKSYEKETEFSQELGEKTKKWGRRITWTAAIIAALIYIRVFLVEIFVSK